VREILLVAGETSGDMHAAGVARELRARGASYHLVGTGGERMRVEGVELLEHSRRMAMMGFLGPLAQLPSAMSLLRTLSRRLRGGSVALVILVDYPEFNMLVARSAHDAGVPVLYYITPQVWAWL
jgi:lipid-A-disaccharide synthase